MCLEFAMLSLGLVREYLNNSKEMNWHHYIKYSLSSVRFIGTMWCLQQSAPNQMKD